MRPSPFSGGAYAEYRDGPKRPVYDPCAGHVPALSPGKRKALVSALTAVLRDWSFSPFEHEASCRHGLRQGLCLDGHGWARADDEAAWLVAESLRNLRARRPTWDQGQPDYVTLGESCSWCHGPMPEGGGGRRYRYCSDLCAQRAFDHRSFEERNERDKAFAAVYRVLKKSRTRARKCVACGEEFHPTREKSTQACCSQSCSARHRAATVPLPRYAKSCPWCGAAFIARSDNAQFCCTAHGIAARDALVGKKRFSVLVFDYLVKPARQVVTPARFDMLMAA